jgi:dTDP-4-amino-4,6-dideoxygalactose transaminase
MGRALLEEQEVQFRALGEPVFVSQPLLPELNELMPMLQEIWEKKYVTNHGPLHQRLEAELRFYLGVDTAMLFTNGTIGLITALKFFDLPQGSEVITSPLTFAATAHAISWNGLKPVFADVLPGTLTLDPDAVAQAITENTSAILGVHVYGTPCDVEAFAALGASHDVRVIYDAAHAFGATIKGTPIGRYGDASVFSFHATKLFNTLEGGLIATPNAQDRDKIYYLRNFGIKNEEEVVEVGINGKMNEVQAAIGLLNLRAVADEKAKRRQLRKRYYDVLAGLDGIQTQPEQPGVESSEQYFPLIIDETNFGRTRDDICDELKARNVFARKYFHPICTDFEPYRHLPIVSTRAIPHVTEVKSRVLCLPFHSGVSRDAVSVIADVFHGRR